MSSDVYTLSLHDALPISISSPMKRTDFSPRAILSLGRNVAAGLSRMVSTRVETILLSPAATFLRSEEHTSELQSQSNLVCRLLLEKKKMNPDMAKKPNAY